MEMGGRKRVVLVGAGHANTQVMKKITQETIGNDVDLIVVSDNQQSFYSGMLPGCIAGLYTVDEIAVDISSLAQATGWKFLQQVAVGVKRDRDELCLANGECVPFDVLCLDIGSQTYGSDVPGVKEYAIATRPLTSLLSKIKEFEKKIVEEKRDVTNSARIVVIGGGVAGVELALALKARTQTLREQILDNQESQNSVLVNVTLVTSSNSVLPEETPSMISTVNAALEARNISVITSNIVNSIEKDCIALQDGSSIGYDLVVWAAGAAPQARFNTDGVLQRDNKGFICVNEFLQAEGRSNVFGAGDCISFTPRDGGLPKAGVFAVREGPVLIDNILATLGNKPLHSYDPQRDFLKLVNLSDGTAIGTKWGFVFEGKWVWKLKDYIDRSWMKLFSSACIGSNENIHFNPATTSDQLEATTVVSAFREPSSENFDVQMTALSKMNDEPSFREEIHELWEDSKTSSTHDT